MKVEPRPIMADASSALFNGREGRPRRQRGKIGYILLWLLGVPLPILFGIYLLKGCT